MALQRQAIRTKPLLGQGRPSGRRAAAHALSQTLIKGRAPQKRGTRPFLHDVGQIRSRSGERTSIHHLVLSAFRPLGASLPSYVAIAESQCTFWCSVLSDRPRRGRGIRRHGLNAPFGAQCFPTADGEPVDAGHLRLNAPFGAQCFPTHDVAAATPRNPPSQCTFWCSVLSDLECRFISGWTRTVSMHLLVLSAFRRKDFDNVASSILSLNAPFGAQCFPTGVFRCPPT